MIGDLTGIPKGPLGEIDEALAANRTFIRD